jgi:hypothetical protein
MESSPVWATPVTLAEEPQHELPEIAESAPPATEAKPLPTWVLPVTLAEEFQQEIVADVEPVADPQEAEPPSVWVLPVTFAEEPQEERPEEVDEPAPAAPAVSQEDPESGLSSEPAISWTKKETEIIEAAKKIYRDGDIPPDITPTELRDGIADLYKREAAAKNEATKKKEAPRDPPSWSTCKRFLEKVKDLREHGLQKLW